MSQTPGAAMASYQDVTWRIEGITCMKCVRLITEALYGFWGITEVLVSKELLTRISCQQICYMLSFLVGG